nr:DExH-box ATP-dependent RNA helicase DExH17 [Tanacetum cinerariifolium]
MDLHNRNNDQSQTHVYCASLFNSVTLINFLLAISPSFKLLDKDSDEGDPLVEINNDDCKIIIERTVFDHIREKAKSFPSFAPKSTTKYPESEETLNLTRKYAKLNIFQKENVLIIDSEPVKPQLKAATQEKQTSLQVLQT